jgi:flagellar hook-associated protein 2
MAGLTLGGLASGMDTDTIISQLLAIESTGRARKLGAQTRAEGRQQGLNDVAVKLRGLKTAADDLRSVSSWANVQTVESSNAAQVSARYTAGAAVGSYSIHVQQLARADQQFFTYTRDVANPTTITIDGVSINIAANATPEEAAAAINGKSDSPAFASVVAGELVFSGKKTGQDMVIGGSTLSQTPAQALKRRDSRDLEWFVDGIRQPDSDTNTVANGLPGIELTLKAVTTTPVSVTVGAPGPDQAALKAKVKAFVDSYNSTIDMIRAKLDEKTVQSPTTSAQWKQGALKGDPGLSAVLSQLRNTLGATVTGDPGNPNPAAFNQLSDIGISVPSAQVSGTVSQDRLLGKLTIDDAKLTAAITGDSTAVKRLLGGVTGIEGMTQKIDAIIDPIANAADGALAERSTQIGREISRIKDDIARFDKRLEAKEKMLRMQFTAMEKALGQSQSQTSWLQGQIAGLGTSSE